MAHAELVRAMSVSAGEGTLRGRRRSHALAIAATTVILQFLAAPSQALAPAGPTSSETVTISVSVAPTVGLQISSGRPIGAETAAERFCVATNTRPADMPVQLVWAASGEPSELRSETPTIGIPWCATGRQADLSGHDRPSEGAALLIVRPE